MMHAIEGIAINGELHTAHDLDLLWLKSASSAQNPAPKRLREEIPGHDGTAEYSDYYDGIVFYENREITYQLCFYGAPDKLKKALDALFRYHGRKITVVEDCDPEFAVTGVAEIAVGEHGFNFAYISLTLDAEPYRRRINPTVKYITGISGTSVIEISNDIAPVQLTVCMNRLTADSSVTASLLISPQTSAFDSRLRTVGQNIVVTDFLLKGGTQRIVLETQTFAGQVWHTVSTVSADLTVMFTEGKF